MKTFVLIFLLLSPSCLYGHSVSDYQLYTAIGSSKDNQYSSIVIRKLFYNSKVHYLTVNPETLSTHIQAGSTLNVSECPWETIRRNHKNTPYIEALRDAELNAETLQDAGITHFFPSQRGVDLTIDLCPSRRPLDRSLFTELTSELGKEEKPVPLAVAITGLWMKEHDLDLQWLLDREKNKELSIVWINHSYNHRTSKELPLRENFLLEKGTDIKFEILQTEAEMIEKGITPSIFFRFPGLVSDDKLFHQVTAYGLIPVGSDAWLGKNQWPKEGSIVLVHANGNEPIGIHRFVQLMKDERENSVNKKWLLFDLRESIVETERAKDKD